MPYYRSFQDQLFNSVQPAVMQLYHQTKPMLFGEDENKAVADSQEKMVLQMLMGGLFSGKQ